MQRTLADVHIGSLQLESGVRLHRVSLRYELIGPSHAPVILVCHALTGSHISVGVAENPGWWSGLIGEGKYIDTKRYRILTFNVLAGCNGSTGPSSIDPETNKPYRTTFPKITIRDMVHAQAKALQKLHIDHLAAVIGGSLGGMQAMEWGLLYPEMMDRLIILAATPVLSDYGIAFNHIAAAAIKNDHNWNGGHYRDSTLLRGLEIARMVGMVTYRSQDLFMERFRRKKQADTFSVNAYLEYQGEALARCFDANSYLYLLEAMNHHDIGEGRGGWKKACKDFKAPVLIVSFGKDLIYTPSLIQRFSEATPQSSYYHVPSVFGHDGFLTEFAKWGPIIARFLANRKI
ncbi:MAG TPA: homoserine O-acetyltransferase [Bacillota bacterium]|nr:homoserine O-acetyltransferase [Bacillota bacterium]